MDKLKATRLTKLSRVKNNVKDNKYGFYEMWDKHHKDLLLSKPKLMVMHGSKT
jgi:hypothetical protein|tara:strand:- start:871 stop:1029 length:159 start_codon:yes stop_codon:yes gene_type:complete